MVAWSRLIPVFLPMLPLYIRGCGVGVVIDKKEITSPSIPIQIVQIDENAGNGEIAGFRKSEEMRLISLTFVLAPILLLVLAFSPVMKGFLNF